MRADIHRGPEQKLQSEAGYIDARPQTDSSTKTSCNARPDHTWWVNPGVFDTREWSGDVRVGGQWRASGIARGEAYALEGKFLEVDPPRKLVQTWHFAGAPGTPSTVSYLLEPIDGGTRLTVRHADIAPPDRRSNVGAGWRSSFDRLSEILSPQPR